MCHTIDNHSNEISANYTKQAEAKKKIKFYENDIKSLKGEKEAMKESSLEVVEMVKVSNVI